MQSNDLNVYFYDLLFIVHIDFKHFTCCVVTLAIIDVIYDNLECFSKINITDKLT